MPVYSMTGFASAAAAPRNEEVPSQPGVTVELRSVNSRFLDIAFRLPDELRHLEPALRDLLVGGLKRGKVEVRAALGRAADEGLPQPSSEQLNRLARMESSVAAWLPKAKPLSVHEALQWCRGSGAPTAAPQWDELTLTAAREGLSARREARGREGERLVQILMERVHKLPRPSPRCRWWSNANRSAFWSAGTRPCKAQGPAMP
jgi:uncharacterized protein (TIGR00255 family)